MMHQGIDPEMSLDDRPQRDEIIEKDEILGLIIDLETMSPDDFYSTYFSLSNRQ